MSPNPLDMLDGIDHPEQLIGVIFVVAMIVFIVRVLIEVFRK